MKRRALLAAGAAALFATPFLARAQAPRVRRLGVVFVGALEASRASASWDEFRRRLGKLGWIEGTNLDIKLWAAGNRPERLPALIKEAVAQNVEVLLINSSPGARAARDFAAGIPVVFAGIGDPVGTGVVSSLARPGGHITGTSIQMTDIAGKQIDLLKSLLPGLARMAELRSPRYGKVALDVSAQWASAAKRSGINLIHLDADKPEDIEPAFEAAARARVQAMVVAPISLYFSEIKRIVELAKRIRLPTVFTSRMLVAAGGLASYGPDFVDAFARAALYVDKILRGASPADLPVEQSDRFELVLNRRTAAELGIAIPKALLLQASEVIE